MTLDRVHHRMFVPEPGNIRVLVYQLDEEGRHVRHTADNVVGHRSVLGRRRNSEINRNDAAGGAETGLAYDHVHDRLFVRDRSRILVFDADPERFSDYPEATDVLGQPDFTTLDTGPGRKHFPRGGELLIDDEHQRLFVEDRTRILVFDIHPDRLETYPEATLVIGQSSFDSREPGLGRDCLARSHGIAFDPEGQRLFVSDEGNQRILIFDVHPDRIQSGPDAVAVLGQPDFESSARRFMGASATPEARRGTRSITPGGLDYDPVHQRLFVSQLVDNRILVFDASPEKLANDAPAIAVLGQPDFETFDPRVSREQFAFPKDPTVDAEKQVLYVSEGFPGGNRVMAFDIRPESLRSGMPAMDVIGHLDDEGRDDFDKRMANDRLDARTSTMARAVALDPVDHRLWVADEYNNRVLGFQLDSENRLLEREARWVIGQPDFHNARAERSRSGMNVPLAVAYDSVDKRLYVGDGWNDRVLIYDVDPERLPLGGGHDAVVVLGQADFESQEPGAARNRFDFAVDRGRGIASNMLPVGIAIDGAGRRAFISDGGNNRVLVFDIDKERLEKGADAVAVLGQDDFTSRRPGLSARAFNAPGHLAYDPDGGRLFVVDNRNHRVLAFDATPDGLAQEQDARFVIGQPDFSTNRRNTSGLSATSLAFPNGVAYDRAAQRLYVADQGNDRVLVYDASAKANGPTALAVLGQKDFVTKSDQFLRDVSAQDQLYDPRGIDFDSEHGHLYVTDSHWARLLVFTFPAARHELSLEDDGMRRRSTLDPVLALAKNERRTGYALLRDVAAAHAIAIRTSTHAITNDLTEQESRMLVSQTASRAASTSRRFVVLLDGSSEIQLTNPGETEAQVELTWHRDGATTRTTTTLPRGGSETLREAGVGTFVVESTTPVAALAWRHETNIHDEAMTTALPVMAIGTSSRTVPNITLGGGYETDLVLVHTGSGQARGEVVLFDDTGREARRSAYVIEAGKHWRWSLAEDRAVPRRYYAVVVGDTAAVTTFVRRVDGGLITATSREPAAMMKRARFPIDTMPDLLRHGRATELRIVIANADDRGASVRFILRDLDGREVDRVEQLLMPRAQVELTLAGLFDRRRFAGTITFVSDVPVALSARQVTTNLRGDAILTEIPIVEDTRANGTRVLPYIDGEGEATQWLVFGAGNAVLELFDPSGEPLPTLLR